MAERLYTRVEAQELLVRLRPLVERGRRLARELAGAGGESSAREVESANGGGHMARRVAAAQAGLRAIEAEISGLGIVYRDPSRGLLDFPAERDGQPIFLCWRFGEHAVDWWHDRDSGFAGRTRLD